MIGTELLLLHLAVDNHDGVGAHVAVLGRLAQVLVLLEQHCIADLEPLCDVDRGVGVSSEDETSSSVLVLQFHQTLARILHLPAQLVDDGHNSGITVRVVWPEWYGPAGYPSAESLLWLGC